MGFSTCTATFSWPFSYASHTGSFQGGEAIHQPSSEHTDENPEFTSTDLYKPQVPKEQSSARLVVLETSKYLQRVAVGLASLQQCFVWHFSEYWKARDSWPNYKPRCTCLILCPLPHLGLLASFLQAFEFVSPLKKSMYSP